MSWIDAGVESQPPKRLSCFQPRMASGVGDLARADLPFSRTISETWKNTHLRTYYSVNSRPVEHLLYIRQHFTTSSFSHAHIRRALWLRHGRQAQSFPPHRHAPAQKGWTQPMGTRASYPKKSTHFDWPRGLACRFFSRSTQRHAHAPRSGRCSASNPSSPRFSEARD